MKTFELSYKIEQGKSWKGENSISIKSNLLDDKLIECELPESLILSLKSEAALLEPDKLVLAIAEAQKREIQTSIEALNDMALQAKVNSDKAHEILSSIAEEAEIKYVEIEKKFTETEKRFTEKMKSTAENIKKDLEKLSSVEEKLIKINSYSLDHLSETLKQLIKIIETDPELVKLVLDHKNKII